MSEHSVLLAVQRQVQGLVDERDALLAANAAKQEQLDALVHERDYWQKQARKWRRAYAGEHHEE